MSKNFNWFTVASVAVGLTLAGNAFATNGYFTHGTGTKNKAMAGSGIALPEDAIDVTNNPAVAPFVGDQLVIGAALSARCANTRPAAAWRTGVASRAWAAPSRSARISSPATASTS